MWSLTSCCDELLVVAYRRVVDERVGYHGGRLSWLIVSRLLLVLDGMRGISGSGR
jgi:hypothetical protein